MTIEQFQFLSKVYQTLEERSKGGRGRTGVRHLDNSITLVSHSGPGFMLTKTEECTIFGVGECFDLQRTVAKDPIQIDEIHVHESGEVGLVPSRVVDLGNTGVGELKTRASWEEITADLASTMRARRIPVPKVA